MISRCYRAGSELGPSKRCGSASRTSVHCAQKSGVSTTCAQAYCPAQAINEYVRPTSLGLVVYQVWEQLPAVIEIALHLGCSVATGVHLSGPRYRTARANVLQRKPGIQPDQNVTPLHLHERQELAGNTRSLAWQFLLACLAYDEHVCVWFP